MILWHLGDDIGTNTTTYGTNGTNNQERHVITGSQIRASRAALRWSAQTLATSAGLGIQTIKRFEAVDGVPPSRTETLSTVKAALEAAGIEFIGSPNDRPGIRYSPPARQSGQ
jgi:hypothetical protein